MKMWTRWIAVNGAFMVLLIAGFVYDNMYAQITFSVLTGLAFVLFLVMYSVRRGLSIQTNRVRKIPRWVDRLYDLITFSVLIWASHIILAVIYIVSMFGITSILSNATTRIEEGVNENI
jgi:hypothetical protein